MKTRSIVRTAALCAARPAATCSKALIAILIFSFGILGLIGLLGSSLRITNDARYRTEAANLASAMIADMWTMTAAQMDTQFGSGGTKLAAWQAKAASLLPSAAAYPPTVDLTQPGLSPQSRTVVVTVYWKLPGETETHQHLMTAQIGKNHHERQDHIAALRAERGVGLMEVMISIVIGMLLVLVIYQVYEISEGQKRTITAGSDAQQNASYGLFVLGRDVSMAGNGIASTAASLDTCAMLRPIPVLIDAGADDSDPDTITVLYGGSSSLSTPVQFKQTATTARSPTWCRGRSASATNDVIVGRAGRQLHAVDGQCRRRRRRPATGFATITHTPVAGSIGRDLRRRQRVARQSGTGGVDGAHRVHGRHDRPRAAHAEPAADRRAREPAHQRRRQSEGPVRRSTPTTTARSTLWQDATGGVWSAANLPTQPLATLQQIRAVRIAIVTRSAQYEKDADRRRHRMPTERSDVLRPAPRCSDDLERRRPALPLQGARNQRPASQRTVERIMNHRRLRSRRRARPPVALPAASAAS